MYMFRNQMKRRRRKELLEGRRQNLKSLQPPKKVERRNRQRKEKRNQQRKERRNQTCWSRGNHHVGGR